MSLSNDDNCSDLLEETHLAYTRGQFREARLMLETLTVVKPKDNDVADLYARVLSAQAKTSDNNVNVVAWQRNFIPDGAGRALIMGICLLAYGIFSSLPAFNAGFTQGFGPLSTVIVPGRLKVHAVPVREMLWHSTLFAGLGIAMIAYFIRQMYRRAKSEV